jgi:hypothetical protein
MNAIARIRNRQTSRARLVFTALVVGWANIILQPCVMAAPKNESDPAIAADHAGHALSDTCPHCGDDVCVGTSGCDTSAVVNSKSAASLADSGTPTFAATRTTWIDATIQSRYVAFQYISTPEALPRPVSLTVVHCVFLK